METASQRALKAGASKVTLAPDGTVTLEFGRETSTSPLQTLGIQVLLRAPH